MKRPRIDLVYLEPAILNRIADKHALDEYQRQNQVEEAPEVENIFADPEIHKLLRDIVHTLPHAERELLTLRYWEDQTFEEMSMTTGLARNVIQRRLTKILSKLRPLILRKMQGGATTTESRYEFKIAV